MLYTIIHIKTDFSPIDEKSNQIILLHVLDICKHKKENKLKISQ